MDKDNMAKALRGLSLRNISVLLNHLSNPHLRVPIVHVAGTNGKGSVCAYVDCILSHAGLCTGRFNSPHLIEPRDSVLIRGQAVSSDVFLRARTEVDRVNQEMNCDASPFELLTATAFHVFANAIPSLDVAVIEVGMGGETDATNVCPSPLASVLTAIDLDHQAILGSTVEEIAKVKAGIIKNGRPCIISPQEHDGVIQVVQDTAARRASALFQASAAEELPDGRARISLDSEPTRASKTLTAHLSLAGSGQLANAACAAMTVQVLRNDAECRLRVPKLAGVTDENISSGLESTRWPGRLEWIDMPVGSAGPLRLLADGAHNVASANLLGQYMASLPPVTKTTLVVALSSPRDPAVILEPLLKHKLGRVQVIATTFSVPVEGMPWVAAQDPNLIAHHASQMGVQDCQVATSVKAALEVISGHAREAESARVVVFGSLYLIADLYRLLGCESNSCSHSKRSFTIAEQPKPDQTIGDRRED